MSKKQNSIAKLRFFSFIFLFCQFLFIDLSAKPQEPRIRDYLEQIRRDTGAPGIAAAVGLKGKLVFSEGVGCADLENMVSLTGSTILNIGSVSKPIAAAAVMQLVERGLVDLDAPIQKYVPYFPEKKWRISVKHILTQTSGIRAYRKGEFMPGGTKQMQHFDSIEQGISFFKDDPLLFKPGDFYNYSTYAINLLQGVVETVIGMDFEDYLKKYVWEPAGMLSTSFDVPWRIVYKRGRGYIWDVDGHLVNPPYEDMSFKYAGGGMLSTAEDLARFGMALNSGKILKPETTALMFKVHVDPVLQYREEGKPERRSFKQALIWRVSEDVQGRKFVYHAGGNRGCIAFVQIYPKENLTVSFIVNLLPFDPEPYVRAIAQWFLNQSG